MNRKTIDLGDVLAGQCTLEISGDPEDVVLAAAIHAEQAHEREDTPELRERIRANLRDVE